MDININIKLDLNEVAEILISADELQKWVLTHIEDIKSWVLDMQRYGQKLDTLANPADPAKATNGQAAIKAPAVQEVVVEETTAEESTKKPAMEISLEEVRAKLAALSQAGKQEQVKNLIQQFNAKKLTDIPKEQYPKLLEEAGKL